MKLLNKGIICLSLGIAFLADSCADESPWGGSNATEGKITLNLVTDGYVTMGTRAEEDTKVIVPELSKFSVSLKKTDGSYNKTWTSVDAFHKEDGFPQGSYIIAAYYGDKDIEGFEKPYYYGETPIQVKLGEESAETVTASLQNALLSIRYTDDLKSMFKNYSATVQTDGHTPVVYAYNETRPAYLAPTTAKIYISLTNDQNETVSLNPGDVSLSAKHHYVVSVGVKTGDTGQATLDVQITEDIFVEPPIEIVLSDELFNESAPSIEAVNFTSGVTISIFDSFPTTSSNPEFHVNARGGIRSAILTLTADKSLPIVGGNTCSFELVNATAEVQSKLNEMKIRCYGLYENPDKMAVVNFKEFEANLPEGSYTASLVVTDNNGKTSATDNSMVTYNIEVIGITYSLDKVETPYFLDNNLKVTVSTNCPDLKGKFTFFSTNANGDIVQINPEDLTIESSTTDNDKYVFIYSLKCDEINDAEWKVQTRYADRKIEETTIDVVMPTFTVATDPFAKRVKIKLDNLSNTNLSADEIIKHLNIKNNGADVSNSQIDRSQAGNNIIILTGLNAKNERVNNNNFDGQYSNIVLYHGKRLTSKYTGIPVASFTTEEMLEVPNGNFSKQGRRMYIQKIKAGGEWAITGSSWYSYRNWAQIDRYEPEGWITNNDLTFFNAGTENTWFKVPSTYINGNNVVIRTVGYAVNGSEPNQSTSGGNYYCTNVPSSLEKGIGKLILGNLNNGVVEGYDFSSRPSSMVFNYSTEGKINEDGELNIIFYGLDNLPIWKEKYNLEYGTQGEKTINFRDYDFQQKINKIYIEFLSTSNDDPQINIPRGSELNEGINYSLGRQDNYIGSNQRGGPADANVYNAVATGSEVKVSNIHFVYE